MSPQLEASEGGARPDLLTALSRLAQSSDEIGMLLQTHRESRVRGFALRLRRSARDAHATIDAYGLAVLRTEEPKA